MLKPDWWIQQMALEHQLISPFVGTQVRQIEKQSVISFGLSSYGYDCRLDPKEFKVFSPVGGHEIDPKNFNPSTLLDVPLKRTEDGSQFWMLPPHSYALGITIETFHFPRNVTGLAIAKSTYARTGVFCNTTPAEAGWSGKLVVEIFNGANLPVKIYANEGFFQMLFFESDPCSVSYTDRSGRYLGQDQITFAKV